MLQGNVQSHVESYFCTRDARLRVLERLRRAHAMFFLRFARAMCALAMRARDARDHPSAYDKKR